MTPPMNGPTTPIVEVADDRQFRGGIFYSWAEIMAEQDKRRPPKYTNTPRQKDIKSWP